jgi:hypothetical protein
MRQGKGKRAEQLPLPFMPRRTAAQAQWADDCAKATGTRGRRFHSKPSDPQSGRYLFDASAYNLPPLFLIRNHRIEDRWVLFRFGSGRQAVPTGPLADFARSPS